jgi:hypothetical protein
MTRVSKVFIILSLLFLAASMEYIVESLYSNTRREKKQTIEQQSHSQAILLGPETAKVTDAVWRESTVSPKGENWTFDLFTAPTIGREEGNFSATLPWLKTTPTMIPFNLIAIERKLYPLQFGGYFSMPTVDNVSSTDGGYAFMLRDSQTNESLTVKVGQSLEKYGVEIKSFEEQGPAGEVQGYPCLIVFDSKLNQEISLTSAPKYYDELWDIKLSLKDDGKEILLSHIGEEFSADSKNYALEAIDFDNKSLKFSQKMGKNPCFFAMSIAQPGTDSAKQDSKN